MIFPRCQLLTQTGTGDGTISTLGGRKPFTPRVRYRRVKNGPASEHGEQPCRRTLFLRQNSIGKALYPGRDCSRRMGDYDQLLKRAKSALPQALSSGERFQVPEPDVVTEGKTTILRNFLDICQAIRRDPNMVLTYLLRELGTAGAQDGPRVVFKGKVTAQQVADRIKAYIDSYVICSECGRPDTHLVKEDRVQMLECEACGARRPVKAIKKPAKVEEKVLEEGKVYEVMIQDVGKKGDGIARREPYIIYIPGTAKGSVVKVYIEKIAGTVAFGKVHLE